MKKTILLAIMAIAFLTNTNAQKIYNHAQDNAANKAAKNIFDEFRKIKELEGDEKIVILPVYSKSKKITAESEYLAEKIAHKLNTLFQEKRLKFNAVNYKEDPLLKSQLEDGTVPDHNDSEYYKELLENYTNDFAISSIYNFDIENNKFIIENITIHSNHFLSGTDKKQVSASSANVENSPGPAPIWRSALVPGWGQIYKEQKFKGYVLLSSEVLFLAGALISQNLSNYNYDEAVKNIKTKNVYLYHLDKSDTWSSMRNMAFIGAGAVYLYNFIDAIASKRKPNYTASLNNKRFQIYPAFYQNTYCVGLNIKLK